MMKGSRSGEKRRKVESLADTYSGAKIGHVALSVQGLVTKKGVFDEDRSSWAGSGGTGLEADRS